MNKSINESEHLIVTGAKEHNLKNIDVSIPKKKLVVITGVSGSGKSSLAFDTIFAEGQRRYVESLSSYARQFIGQLEKPKYNTIRGLSPTIAIEQKSASRNPRSTVGTITEIYDYLRVFYARLGEQHCIKCDSLVGRGDAESMVTQIMSLPVSTKIILLAPIVANRKGEYKELFQELLQQGYQRIRLDGNIIELAEVPSLHKHKKHNIEIVIDRLIIKNDSEFRKRLTDSVEQTLKAGNGELIVHIVGREDIKMSEARSCCGIAYPELEPSLFSFNSPLGMCPDCNGIGTILSMDEDKIIPNKNLSIEEGAIIPWKNYFQGDINQKENSWGISRLKAMSKTFKIDFSTPWKDIPKAKRDIILHGGKNQKLKVFWNSNNIKAEFDTTHEGLLPTLMRRYLQTTSESQKKWYSQFLSDKKCSTCNGKRLKEEVLHVRINKLSIIDFTALSVDKALSFIQTLKLDGNKKIVAEELIKEINARLSFLMNVGLNYLSLDRSGPTLSGGESQRIRLASQIGSELTGVLYILDEPSIGLHQRDNIKLINTLCHLRDIGNTVLVVEHDQETMEHADQIIDMGPGAGHLGGQIVAQGTLPEIINNPHSPTGKYLSGREKIEVPTSRRKISDNQKYISILGACENNLKNIDVHIPLSRFVCISGVSGAGKSTLINQILYPALSNEFSDNPISVGKHKGIRGIKEIDKVINIDQKPIGRTPRSNPATYTKLFDLIRDLFEMLPESKARGYSKGRFSFNVKGGRCEKCSGDGYITVAMHFLADVLVPCEVCKGKRFNQATLEVKYKGHSISDVLDLSVHQARELFANHKKIVKVLDTLMDVGLSYIKLGQAATTLSGGEAQRIKLARELSRASTGKTFYILDEPTTGLHFQDISMLLNVLNRLTDQGNTILVIEHNLDVIKTADWIIDMGPEGGNNGGQIIAVGPPEQVAQNSASVTGKYLKVVVH